MNLRFKPTKNQLQFQCRFPHVERHTSPSPGNETYETPHLGGRVGSLDVSQITVDMKNKEMVKQTPKKDQLCSKFETVQLCSLTAVFCLFHCWSQIPVVRPFQNKQSLNPESRRQQKHESPRHTCPWSGLSATGGVSTGSSSTWETKFITWRGTFYQRLLLLETLI